jgi:hypothetical protein
VTEHACVKGMVTCSWVLALTFDTMPGFIFLLTVFVGTNGNTKQSKEKKVFHQRLI